MPDTQSPDVEGQREALKVVAVALKESALPFALTGGYAAWVHGAPEPLHDVDFLVRPADATAAVNQLRRRGLTVQEPPEDWLFKVSVHDTVVDVLHRAQGEVSVDAMLSAAGVESVLSVHMPVVSATDVVTEKLLALDEHYCDLAEILPTLRALREQVDWPQIRRRTSARPFAEAVLFLAERLDIIGPPADG